MKQHPARHCRHPHPANPEWSCDLSFCEQCVRKYYAPLTLADVEDQCPRCAPLHHAIATNRVEPTGIYL
eukprot:3531931-Pyramimonas_sp.AAC.1